MGRWKTTGVDPLVSSFHGLILMLKKEQVTGFPITSLSCIRSPAIRARRAI